MKPLLKSLAIFVTLANYLTLLALLLLGIYIGFIWEKTIDVNAFMCFANIAIIIEVILFVALLYIGLAHCYQITFSPFLVVSNLFCVLPASAYLLYMASDHVRDFLLLVLKWVYPM